MKSENPGVVEAGPRARLARAIPFLAFALLLLVVYADPLFRHRNFTGRDMPGYHLPVEHAIHSAWSRGRLPVWFADISGGRPLLGNPNAGALYPVRPLLSVLPFPVAMRIYPVLHHLIAGAGMILLLQGLGLSAPAAWIGAVTYALSGVMVSEVIFTNIQPGMAILPWFLWALGRAGGRAVRILLLSVLFGLAFSIGDVFSCVLVLLCCALWLAFQTEVGGQKAGLGAVAAGLVLGGLLAAPQLVAAALWIPFTNRSVLGMKLGEVFLYSISPFRLLELVVPFPFGNTWEVDPHFVWGWPVFRNKQIGFFASLYPGALALIALVKLRRSRKPGVRFAKALLFVTLAIAVPPSLWPARWNQVSSPLPLRYPEKFAVGIVLALAILAASAFEEYRAGARVPRWVLAVGAVLALAASATALLPGPTGRFATAAVGAESRFAPVAASHIPAALAEGGLFWMATLVGLEALRGRRAGLAAALVVLTLVPVLATRRIALTTAQEDLLAPTTFDRWLSKRDPERLFATLSEAAYQKPSDIEAAHSAVDPNYRRNWDHYEHSLWGRPTILNYDFDGGDLSRLETLRQTAAIAASYQDSSNFWGGLGLRWAIRYRDQRAFAGYRPVGGDSLQIWDEHERPFSTVRLAQTWFEADTGLSALPLLAQLSPGEIVVESGRSGRGRAPAGSIRLLENSPERLTVETQSSAPAWLFVVRGFFPFRDVTLDGRTVDVLPADVAFSAVAVPAGTHRLDWRERVPGWNLSRFGPALFVLGIAAVFALSLSARRKETR